MATEKNDMGEGPGSDADLANALAKLSPEDAAMFMKALDMTMRRRRLLMLGYGASLLALVGGLLTALYVYGTREPGTFAGWVFLVPFAAVGLILYTFGRLAKAPKDKLLTREPSAVKKAE